MRSILTGSLAAILVLLPLVSAQAAGGQGESEAAGTKYEAAKGFYVQAGFAVIKTNGGKTAAASKANLGAAGAFGYRFSEWLGSDVQFVWAGRDQGAFESRQSSITLNAKFYPVGLFAPDFLDSFQPYAVIGMGGAHLKFKPGLKQASFAFRAGAGIEWMLTDHLGAYADGSVHATPRFKIGGKGGATGIGQVGLKLKF